MNVIQQYPTQKMNEWINKDIIDVNNRGYNTFHCENRERHGGSYWRRLCRQRVTAEQASLTPSDRTPTMGAG